MLLVLLAHHIQGV